ncbi:MAG TPA: hypothetical protein ENO23_06915, partial [Alphaproteobacteria bacterium]|nr:hypothetical protein [Alphaproteobacteria bacterium]
MHAGWLGVFALGVVAVATAVWFRAARAVRLPASRTPFVVAWLGGAALGAVALTAGAGWMGGIAAGLAVAAGATLSLLVAISGQAVAADAIRVGEPLRPFTAF